MTAQNGTTQHGADVSDSAFAATVRNNQLRLRSEIKPGSVVARRLPESPGVSVFFLRIYRAYIAPIYFIVGALAGLYEVPSVNKNGKGSLLIAMLRASSELHHDAR